MSLIQTWGWVTDKKIYDFKEGSITKLVLDVSMEKINKKGILLIN